MLSQVLGWYQLSPGRAGILWFVVLTYKLGMLGSVSDQLPACLWAVGLGLMGCVCVVWVLLVRAWVTLPAGACLVLAVPVLPGEPCLVCLRGACWWLLYADASL